MPIKLQGKDYRLVSERLKVFWDRYDDFVIRTSVDKLGQSGVVMKAEIVNGKTNGIVSTGHAAAPFTPNDKALEKAETTAVGRALAFLDADLMGSEIASADEIQNWSRGEVEKKLYKQFAAHMGAVHRHTESLEFIRANLLEGNLPAALEAWREIGEDDMRILWKAPSRGGWFSTEERKLLDQASNEDFVQRKSDVSN